MNTTKNTAPTTADEAWATFNAQTVAPQPGEFAWWQVWGARPHNIRPGDIVAIDGDEPVFVEDTFEAAAAPIRVGVVIDGKRQTIGALCPVRVIRWTDRNTLA